ncbi:MAG: bifunctional DNA-formamidopyrimidine glycosylase/DNA-(apurinic or apyrimidinic site) lyase [Hyphomicrobiales bacterium]|nr:bifunctional DNA-formamidopyrimidine glycosylase/DNA-(apurinic or apyrimidinic site) lyase [Hyphomicrobiales bacterium]MCP5370134.1 bifunctional DNA-formamidopyrimidine glycosylase/DNA-(apurinic or apyrimidinic site) lyase [Hyphomicrobiales bacterium]
MPELPEVETVRRGLAAALEGRRLAAVVVRRPDLRFPFPAGFADRLAGRRVARVGRRAKFLLLDLDDGAVVLWHLGMSGRVKILRGAVPGPEKHDHVDLVVDDGTVVRYWDSRRFGFMGLSSGNEIAVHPMLAHLGPEPLDPAFDGAVLGAALRGRRTSIKAALMDQRVVAGLGNIYVCESLFRAGISPRRGAHTVAGARAGRLAAAIKEVLAEALAAGGTTLRDHRLPTGELGYFQQQLGVYGRAGAPCPGCDCDPPPGGGIRHLVQGGRSTFYCPNRQR